MKKNSGMKVSLSSFYGQMGPTKTIDELTKKKPAVNTEVSGTYNVSMQTGLKKEEEKMPDFYERCKSLAKSNAVDTETISKLIILEFRRMYLDSIKGDGQQINVEWFRYTDEVLFNVMQPIFKYMIDRSILCDDVDKKRTADIAENVKEIILRSFNNANMFVEFDSKYSYDYTNFYRALDKFFDTFN